LKVRWCVTPGGRSPTEVTHQRRRAPRKGPRFTIPVWLRRLATKVPAFIVVALGVDATRALVIS
jgi:hypothetical protein